MVEFGRGAFLKAKKMLGSEDGGQSKEFAGWTEAPPPFCITRRTRSSSCESPRGNATGSSDLFTFAST